MWGLHGLRNPPYEGRVLSATLLSLICILASYIPRKEIEVVGGSYEFYIDEDGFRQFWKVVLENKKINNLKRGGLWPSVWSYIAYLGILWYAGA